MASHNHKRFLPPITSLEIPTSHSHHALPPLPSPPPPSPRCQRHHSTVLPPVSSFTLPSLILNPCISTNNSSSSSPISPSSSLLFSSESSPSLSSQLPSKTDATAIPISKNVCYHYHSEKNPPTSYYHNNSNNNNNNFDHHQLMQVDYSYHRPPHPTPQSPPHYHHNHNQHNLSQLHQAPLSPLSPHPSMIANNNNNATPPLHYHSYAATYNKNNNNNNNNNSNNNNHYHSSSAAVGGGGSGGSGGTIMQPSLSQQQQLPPQMMMMMDPSCELLAEKRRRNAGASARFRDRRKQREREMQEKCQFLEKRVQELENTDGAKRILELEKALINEKETSKLRIQELEKDVERLSSKSCDNEYVESLTPPCSSSGDYDSKDNIFEEILVTAVNNTTKVDSSNEDNDKFHQKVSNKLTDVKALLSS